MGLQTVTVAAMVRKYTFVRDERITGEVKEQITRIFYFVQTSTS
jgi:hypothetical protein